MSTIPIEHPTWCSPVWCGVGQAGGAHRSQPTVFSAIGVEIELGLHRAQFSDFVFVTVSIYNTGDANAFHLTVDVTDAHRLVDTLSGLLGQAS